MSRPERSLYVAARRGPPFRIAEQGPKDYLLKKWADNAAVSVFEVIPVVE